MTGFGFAVAYNMARLQENIHKAYLHPFAVSNAGLDSHATLGAAYIATLKAGRYTHIKVSLYNLPSCALGSQNLLSPSALT